MATKKTILIFLFLALSQLTCTSQKTEAAYDSETLRIIPVSSTSFVHVSYLDTQDYGKVACNGMIYLDDQEAIVFDTPAVSSVSKELLNWLTKIKKCEVKAVVINHFHIDCLGGLDAFHTAGVPSYANNTTIALAKKDSATIPQKGFDLQNELTIGDTKIINRHFGEAHTKDNIISYIPSEEVLFGGCMIKSLKAPKGNLADANTDEWSHTVRKIKETYPNAKTVVPGHGAYGGTELFDYTIELFNPE